MSSRVEQILNGETVKPQSRVEELLEDLVDLADSPISYNDLTDRTHYEHHNVTSYNDFKIELTGGTYDARRGPCRMGEDVIILSCIGSGLYDARKGGWPWIREGVGNLRAYLYINDTKIEIPLETITDLTTQTHEETYNGCVIQYKCTQGTALLDSDGDGIYTTVRHVNCLMVMIRNYGVTDPLPDARVDYGTLELVTLDEKYIPDTIARVSDIPTVPDPVTDDHINSLIDAKLGVIENGTY